jgi:hypothetical protein
LIPIVDPNPLSLPWTGGVGRFSRVYRSETILSQYPLNIDAALCKKKTIDLSRFLSGNLLSMKFEYDQFG